MFRRKNRCSVHCFAFQFLLWEPPAQLTMLPPVAAPERRGTELGFAIFQQHCVSCHGNPAYERAPDPATLRTMPAERIYTALTSGVMKSVGDTLSEEDRAPVSESLAGELLGYAQAGDAGAIPTDVPAIRR